MEAQKTSCETTKSCSLVIVHISDGEHQILHSCHVEGVKQETAWKSPETCVSKYGKSHIFGRSEIKIKTVMQSIHVYLKDDGAAVLMCRAAVAPCCWRGTTGITVCENSFVLKSIFTILYFSGDTSKLLQIMWIGYNRTDRVAACCQERRRLPSGLILQWKQPLLEKPHAHQRRTLICCAVFIGQWQCVFMYMFQ